MDGFYLGLGEALRGSGGRVLVVRPGFVRTQDDRGPQSRPRCRSTPSRSPTRSCRGVARRDDLVWVPARAARRDVRACGTSRDRCSGGCRSERGPRRPALPRRLGAAPAAAPARPRARARLRPDATTWSGSPTWRCARTSSGLGTALPRAVPSDAVVAVLDELVCPACCCRRSCCWARWSSPGSAALRLAGRYAGRPASPRSASTVWNPFVVERLWLGHWTVLLGLRRRCRGWCVEGAGCAADEPGRRAALAAAAAGRRLSASAGTDAAALALLVPGVAWRRRRRNLLLVAACLAANAPWLVAGLLHACHGHLDRGRVGLRARSPRGRCRARWPRSPWAGSGTPRWCPASRHSLLLAVVATVALAAAAAYGLRPLRRRLGDRTTAVAGGAVGGRLRCSRSLTWARPGAIGWLAGARARAAACCATAAAGWRCARRSSPPWSRPPSSGSPPACATPARGSWSALAGALLPLALLPGRRLGAGRVAAAGGTTRPTTRGARAAVAAVAGARRRAGAAVHQLPRAGVEPRPQGAGPGRSLPDARLPRQRPARGLRAGAGGGGPAGAAGARGAAGPTIRPSWRGGSGTSGSGWSCEEHGAPGSPRYDAPVAGTVVHRGPALTVTRIDAPVRVRESSAGRAVAVAVGWTAFLAGPLVAIVPVLWRKGRKWAGSRPTGW